MASPLKPCGALALVCCVWAPDTLPAQPPGGYEIDQTYVDKRIAWSDGIVSRVDVRFPKVTPPAGGWPAVLCLHGRGGHRGKVTGMARFFARRGYLTIAFDIRPYGATADPPNPPTLDHSPPRRILDCVETLALIKRVFPSRMDDTRLACAGVSMGGGISLDLTEHSGKPLPLKSTWSWIRTTGPAIQAIVSRISPIDHTDVYVPEKGDLLSAEYARILSDNRRSTNWIAARTGQYELLRSRLMANPYANRSPMLRTVKGVAIQVQLGWDDRLYPPGVSLEGLAALGHPSMVLVSGPGHASPDNVIDSELNLDHAARWLDRWVKGRQNGVDKQSPFESAVVPVDPMKYLAVNSAWAHRFSPVWPPATPLRKHYLRGNNTLTLAPPTGVERDQVITHTLPAGYDLVRFISEGGGTDAALVTIKRDIEEFVGSPLVAELELFGRPKVTATVAIDKPHFQINATLWVRDNDNNDRFLSSGTFGRRLTTPGTKSISFEMRDVSFVLPKRARLVVKLHNLSWDGPPGQNRLQWVPDLYGSTTVRVRISDQLPAVLHLPVRARRGVDFVPRFRTVSSKNGFRFPMSIDGGAARAGRVYVIVFGLSGIAPPLRLFGEEIWLRPDALTGLVTFAGVLDTSGTATRTFGALARVVPPGWRFAMVSLVLEGGGIVPSEPTELDVVQ